MTRTLYEAFNYPIILLKDYSSHIKRKSPRLNRGLCMLIKILKLNHFEY
jgi:hypothetical protein